MKTIQTTLWLILGLFTTINGHSQGIGRGNTSANPPISSYTNPNPSYGYGSSNVLYGFVVSAYNQDCWNIGNQSVQQALGQLNSWRRTNINQTTTTGNLRASNGCLVFNAQTIRGATMYVEVNGINAINGGQAIDPRINISLHGNPSINQKDLFCKIFTTNPACRNIDTIETDPTRFPSIDEFYRKTKNHRRNNWQSDNLSFLDYLF